MYSRPGLFRLMRRASREVVEELQAGFALLVLERIDGGREPRDDREVASSSSSTRSARRAFRSRSTAIAAWLREESEQLHLLRG